MRTPILHSITREEYHQYIETGDGNSWGGSRAAGPDEVPIIAFCHLSWNWVWQRPQQFLSRMSLNHPLLFVETYCSGTAVAFTKQWRPPGFPKVMILEMHLPERHWADGSFVDNERLRLMKEFLATADGAKFEESILWFNDPMAVTAFAGSLGEKMIIYDCMDELTQFKGAPPELAVRELELTVAADLIFCGGRRMRDKRLPLNPNTHFYGTGVDCRHFGQAMGSAIDPHPAMSGFSGPILGYFGVIDERIDYDLLSQIADAHPEWNVVMIGPFAKVSAEDIPSRPNLHWLGSRPYEDLPALTRHMDICLMPFALNEATEYINPTKALEYMAAGKPVVSTGLQEVLTNFDGVCRIGSSTRHFIRLCEEELRSPSHGLIGRGIALAAENTWEAIAMKMEGHIQEFLAESMQSFENKHYAARGDDSATPATPAYV